MIVCRGYATDNSSGFRGGNMVTYGYGILSYLGGQMVNRSRRIYRRLGGYNA